MDPSDLSGTWVLKLNVVCAVEKKNTGEEQQNEMQGQRRKENKETKDRETKKTGPSGARISG